MTRCFSWRPCVATVALQDTGHGVLHMSDRAEETCSKAAETFDQLSQLVKGINAAIKVLRPGESEILATARYDAFGRCLVVLHDDEQRLTKEMELAELMQWVRGAHWAVAIITGSWTGEQGG